MKLRFLVTGGAGFIGSHLVDRLISLNHKVLVLDNLSSGKKENLNKNADFFKIDIKDQSLKRIFANKEFDIVFHLAAQSDVSKSLKNPKKDLEENVLGTLNILDLSARGKVKKFIFANSVALFGEPKYLPLDEKHPPNPISFYGLSKYTASQLVKLYGTHHNRPYIDAIFSNVYGPRQNPFSEGGVIAIFSYKMLQGERPEIFGDGNQTRDFIFVGDLIDALLSTLKVSNEKILIGTGIETSINELYNKLAKLLNYSKKPIYKPKKEGDILRNVISIKKAKKVLNFVPKTSLEEGILKTINYFKENY